jgi:hypothetical protein
MLGKLEKKGQIERYVKSVVAIRMERSFWITQKVPMYFHDLIMKRLEGG